MFAGQQRDDDFKPTGYQYTIIMCEINLFFSVSYFLVLLCYYLLFLLRGGRQKYNLLVKYVLF